MGKKERDAAEEKFSSAVSIIEANFGSTHPMMCKFRSYLVEALNQKDESPERNKTMNDICDENLDIVQKTYGKESLFCIKPMYTAYTARLHQESIKGCEDILVGMSQLKYDEKAIK